MTKKPLKPEDLLPSRGALPTDLKAHLEKHGVALLGEMERDALEIRDLVLAQPCTKLLGYLWSQYAIAALKEAEKADGEPPVVGLVRRMQSTLEYVHAIWSTHPGPYPEIELDVAKAERLIELCDGILSKALMHSMASSARSSQAAFGDASQDVEFLAKQTWILIRGHRYQVLEYEFFEYVLKPHEDALTEAYGIGATAIASEIQAIADSFREGFGRAMEAMGAQHNTCRHLMEAEGLTMAEAVARLRVDNPEFNAIGASAYLDMFEGGICNVSKHTSLPEPLLQDLAYNLGGNNDFFAVGAYAGTPFRTLPARVRPLIKLKDGYYATDGQFVRDTAYRAIQRGLIARLNRYREGWNGRQKVLIEEAFPTVFSKQLRGASIFREVYFRDVATNQWVETDLIGHLDDALFVVEAKAGVMAMHSPATDFAKHVRTIKSLVTSAYDQCRRFFDYLNSAPEVPIYALRDGNYVEVSRLRKASFRCLFPIGLTVEGFTPFSAMCKQLPGLGPLLGAYPFMSMSVDDLFVLRRFLPTTGALLHYLEVRQAVAGLPRAHMFDEHDHLGAYIRKNRFDLTMREQLSKADFVTWDSFSEDIDRYFQGEDWQSNPLRTRPVRAAFW